MAMRITGLATGLDTDEIIKTTMQPYRIKIDQTKQKKEVTEIKQKLYLDVLNDGKKFYDKYFNIAKSDSLLNSKNYNTIKFDSKDETIATATGLTGAVKDNYSVEVKHLATATKASFTADELFKNDPDPTKSNDIRITYGKNADGTDKTITIKSDDLNIAVSDAERAAIMNNELSKIGLKASTSDFTSGIVIESKETGAKIGTENNIFKIEVGKVETQTITNADGESEDIEVFNPGNASISNNLSSKVAQGTDLEATVTSSRGTVKFGGADGTRTSGSNSVILDGIQFKFSNETAPGEKVKLIGKVDAKDTMDKIVSFVNDYNSYIEKLNKLITDKHDKSYAPLTADQKKEMSEDEIKLWNERVEKGQLSRDSDISRIVNNLKSAMTSSVQGITTGIEKIGIEPVKDYKTKNGMLTINEDKLKSALESDPDAVMKLFTQRPPTGDDISDAEKFNKTGILYRMKGILEDEITSITKSPIYKKAAEAGTAFFTSPLAKSIQDYERKIEDMEKAFTTREQKLYSKYAKLEKIMNNYNSQQSYLASYMGGGQ